MEAREDPTQADHRAAVVAAVATAVYHQRYESEASSAMGVIHLSRLEMRDKLARCLGPGWAEGTRTRAGKEKDTAVAEDMRLTGVQSCCRRWCC